jgi:hypothetical protein
VATLSGAGHDFERPPPPRANVRAGSPWPHDMAQVRTSASADAAIARNAIQPRTLTPGPLTRLPMIDGLPVMRTWIGRSKLRGAYHGRRRKLGARVLVQQLGINELAVLQGWHRRRTRLPTRAQGDAFRFVSHAPPHDDLLYRWRRGRAWGKLQFKAHEVSEAYR